MCLTKSSKSISTCFNISTNVVVPLSPAMIGGLLGSSTTVICIDGNFFLTTNAVSQPATPPPSITRLEAVLGFKISLL